MALLRFPERPLLKILWRQLSFLNQAPNQVNGLFADSSLCDLWSFQQSVAENFNVVAAGPTYGITEIKLWGGYFPENIPNTTDDFTILIHSDAGWITRTDFYTRYNLQATSEYLQESFCLV